MTDTATARQDRVFSGALALLLHRNGPAVFPSPTEADQCIAFCVALEAKVASALGVPQPF